MQPPQISSKMRKQRFSVWTTQPQWHFGNRLPSMEVQVRKLVWANSLIPDRASQRIEFKPQFGFKKLQPR